MRPLALLLLLALPACDALLPAPDPAAAPGPESRCASACASHAHACTPSQCARGCRLVLDKLLEREGPHVLACVARAKPAQCTDVTFADCAARSGPYLDGGPLPPRPPSGEDEDENR